MTTVVRASTACPNLKYMFLPLLSGDMLKFTDQNGKASVVVDYIKNLIVTLAEGERGIVFCLTKNDTVAMADHLGCATHHSCMPTDDHICVMAQFLSPEREGYCCDFWNRYGDGPARGTMDRPLETGTFNA